MSSTYVGEFVGDCEVKFDDRNLVNEVSSLGSPYDHQTTASWNTETENTMDKNVTVRMRWTEADDELILNKPKNVPWIAIAMRCSGPDKSVSMCKARGVKLKRSSKCKSHNIRWTALEDERLMMGKPVPGRSIAAQKSRKFLLSKRLI